MALFIVDTLTDENNSVGVGDVSLREAIDAANALAGADTIEFSATLSGTITLLHGELTITESLTIDGLGASELTIDGNSMSRVFTIEDGDIDGADEIVEISGLTITGGATLATTAFNGGGILNREILTINDSVIRNNSATTGGGGLTNTGLLTVNNSHISHNTSTLGGGLFNNGDTARATVNNSTLSGNSAIVLGGGLMNTTSTVILNNSTVSGNSVVTGNGGGVFNSFGSVVLNNSTVSGNSAVGLGGGIVQQGTGSVTIANSTIAANMATISGGGIVNSQSTAVTLRNSVVSGNTAMGANEIFNIDGTVTANANNLLGHGDQSDLDAFFTFTPGTSDIKATSDGINAPFASILEPLADNGGPTQTHALADNSPAIDAGDNGNVPNDGGDQDNDTDITEDVPFDQRGTVARIRDGNGDGTATVDIGAYEECFLTGTHILTDKGEVAVETLRIGDLVQTADGTLEPIKWIGRQTREPGQVRNPLRSYPIHIKAGALGNSLPHRDLFVSPDHALLFEGLLINAGALVNGTSILKTEPTETFTYYHVELEKHALLVAEGLAAESYLPQNEDRLVYDNGAEYEEMYPHGSKIILWPLDYPRISSAVTVPRHIRKQLNQIANAIGLGEKVA